ncbi:hypothetical protein OUZ56_002531 [Daphnia magna]|uniref:Uncharacterized protein n=1 Tax=Daphnia magna TaxID=35525 RepID=A0ABR0A626_9CRUS|nr:hypothetical protein OUZ56_002531 [Daphnia magna]
MVEQSQCRGSNCERYANRVSLFSIRNRNGFEEDIDGVLVLKKAVLLPSLSYLQPSRKRFISTSGKTKGTHRSSAISEDYCHRKKITSLIDSEGESETQKFATTKQIRLKRF